jgi:hypothetical protein
LEPLAAAAHHPLDLLAICDVLDLDDEVALAAIVPEARHRRACVAPRPILAPQPQLSVVEARLSAQHPLPGREVSGQVIGVSQVLRALREQLVPGQAHELA